MFRFLRPQTGRFSLAAALTAIIAFPLQAQTATAAPALVMDVASGNVLYQQEATRPWYPASLTKLMTVYVALSAVRDHKIALDTPLLVSARAVAMPPSKMGFVPGTQVTLDNALKMLMVRSANDIAITVAEGVSGSVEAFAEDMNQAAAQLGLRESHFVNPNGLPAAGHVSSARDMALIARALYRDFPDQAGLFNLGALGLGTEIIPNHNNMLGRYPGADGMKTGFTCSAGFNVVVTAYRDGRRLLVVILGAPSVATRTAKAAALLDRSFAGIDRPIATITALPDQPTAPPDLRSQVCKRGPHAALIAQANAEINQLAAPLTPPAKPGEPQQPPMAEMIAQMPQTAFEPVPVHIGPEVGYSGLVAQARPGHSPIGTDPGPVAAIAYAPPASQGGVEDTASPLHPDASALPLKGRGPAKRAAHAKAHPAKAVKHAAAKEPAKPKHAPAPKKKGAAASTGSTKGVKSATGDMKRKSASR